MNNETAVVTREQQALELAPTSDKPATASKTAQELRVVEVSDALAPAYQKASTLELTDEEIEAIMAPFADEYVEIRPHDGLIFIPHIHISNRLNKVLKPGKWALIRRREWFDQSSNTMFGEYILVIRGCYVGESVGGHPFQPNNPKVNYSDTLESTAAEALRRIAGKRLSCGSQVWDPEYCRQWQSKYAVQVRGRWERRAQDYRQPPQEQPQATNTAPKATERATGPTATQETASAGDWREIKLHFGKNKGATLGELDQRTLGWYQNQWEPKEWPAGSGKFGAQDIALRAALNASMKQTEQRREEQDDVDYGPSEGQTLATSQELEPPF